MDKLMALKMFVATVETGSFSAASKQLQTTTSTISRMVSSLEKELGTVLLNRSPKQTSVTQAGENYYREVRKIIGELNNADELIRDTSDQPSGPLSVTLPIAFSRDLMAPHLSGFIRRYPRIMLNLTVSDTLSDLFADSVDLAIRLGVPEPMEGVISRKLGEFQRWVVATPGYLRQHGRPLSPGDLAEHNCLRFNYGTEEQVWRFVEDHKEQVIPISGSYRSNNTEILKAAALSDAGIALLPEWLIGEEVWEGRLERLFENYHVNPNHARSVITALYVPDQRGSGRVNAFIDFFMETLRQRAPDFGCMSIMQDE